MRIDKQIVSGKIRLSKKEVERVRKEEEEVVLLLLSSERAALLNISLWKRWLKENLSGASTKERRERIRVHFSKTYTIKSTELESGEITVPSKKRR